MLPMHLQCSHCQGSLPLRYGADVAVIKCCANESRAAKAQAMAGIAAELAANVLFRQVEAAAVPPPGLTLYPTPLATPTLSPP